jgi:adenylyltransferase/sulfurtransferase
LTLFDALEMKFRELKLRRNPECPVCSDNPTQTELIDYEQFCGIPKESEVDSNDIDITPAEVKAMIDRGEQVTILDVRNPQEYEICRIDGSILIPVSELAERFGELDAQDFIVAHCHHGPRSTRAVGILQQVGFDRVKNMAGGIDEWSTEVDPSIVRY